MGLQRIPYTDPDGRKYTSVLPEGVSSSRVAQGALEGPPPLDRLGLPKDTEVRLHNELFVRGIHTQKDARSRREEIVASLMSALRADAEAVYQMFFNVPAEGAGVGTVAGTETPVGARSSPSMSASQPQVSSVQSDAREQAAKVAASIGEGQVG